MCSYIVLTEYQELFFSCLRIVPLLIEACAVLIPDLLTGLLSNWRVAGSRNGEQ